MNFNKNLINAKKHINTPLKDYTKYKYKKQAKFLFIKN